MLSSHETEEQVINRRINAINEEISTYYPEYTKMKYSGETVIKISIKLQELLDYQKNLETTLAQCRENEQLKRQETGKFYAIKHYGQKIKEGVLTIGNRIGAQAMGLGLLSRATRSPNGWGSYFLNVIAAPLYIAIAAVDSISDIYATWKDAQIKQRKTRYTAGLVTLGLVSVGFAIVAGALTLLAAPIALPLVFVGISLVASFKFNYLMKQTQLAIDRENLMIANKEKELKLAISSVLAKQSEQLAPLVAEIKSSHDLIRALASSRQPNAATLALAEQHKNDGLQYKLISEIQQDPRIQRLSFQLEDHKNQLARLTVHHQHYSTNKKAATAMAVGASILILAVLSAPIAPLAFILGIAGLIVLAVGASKYDRKVSDSALEKVEESFSSKRALGNESETIKAACEKQLEAQNYLITSLKRVKSSEQVQQPRNDAKASVSVELSRLSSSTTTLTRLAESTGGSAKQMAASQSEVHDDSPIGNSSPKLPAALQESHPLLAGIRSQDEKRASRTSSF